MYITQLLSGHFRDGRDVARGASRSSLLLFSADLYIHKYVHKYLNTNTLHSMMGAAQRDAEGLAELERLAAFFVAAPASTSQQAAGEHVDDGGGNARRDIARSVYVEEQDDRRGVGRGGGGTEGKVGEGWGEGGRKARGCRLERMYRWNFLKSEIDA